MQQVEGPGTPGQPERAGSPGGLPWEPGEAREAEASSNAPVRRITCLSLAPRACKPPRVESGAGRLFSPRAAPCGVWRWV